MQRNNCDGEPYSSQQKKKMLVHLGMQVGRDAEQHHSKNVVLIS